MDPPGYRYTESTIWNCQFCAHRRDIQGWATCAKYECRVHLNSLCEGFEARGERDVPPPTSGELRRLDGPWMKLPRREDPPEPATKQGEEDDWPWRRRGARQGAGVASS